MSSAQVRIALSDGFLLRENKMNVLIESLSFDLFLICSGINQILANY